MPSQHVIQLCASNETVISALAAEPGKEPTKLANSLFKKNLHSHADSDANKDETDLDRAARCGKFPYRPSDLFLKIYNDVLVPLEKDPLVGLVSPSLMGSSGVIPLSIVSVIPDIMRHYAELIVQAQTEVFIATNYWEPSHSAALVSDAIRELSKRVQSRNGKNVVVKLMYDRGTPSQVFKNHAIVKPDGWEKVGLPKQEEIPHVDLEVVNYHRPVVGTFHAKYLIMDRKVACLNSNNIQDRPNVEMMVHLEGPIVDSFYDMALLSWSIALTPPLPLLSNQLTVPGDYQFQDENPYLKYIDPQLAGKASRGLLNEQSALEGETNAIGAGHNSGQPSGRADSKDPIANHPNMNVPSQEDRSSNDNLGDHQRHAKLPTDGLESSHGSEAKRNDSGAGEDEPASQQGSQGKEAAGHLAEISKHLNAGNMDVLGTAEDDNALEDFSPHIMHQPHKPFPMAMVNRHPRGTPGHGDVHLIPQNIAWLSAMKYAQQSVFVQTPTFNAVPMVEATLDTCRRGIQVTLYLDLGFNDQGEELPMQGGTNETVIHGMYQKLNAEGKQGNLKVYWYTAKDQTKPISATAKERNCHVKFMAVDGEVAIFGNGNQDTQSWFHSQEINVMADSKQVVAEWIKGINANQNTFRFGLIDSADGVYKDREGNLVQASGTKSAGMKGLLKGIDGAIKRVEGKGGF